jgi:hypothetical protein
MYHYLLVFNDRSETRGAGFKDEDVLKVDDFYVARIESEDPLVQPMLGWCVAYAGLWRPTGSYALQTVNLGANCRGEIHACVKKAMNTPELKLITV